MWKNNLKLALRVLWKNKTYSLLNIFGLALGFACCLLIGLYVQNELSYDRYHEKHERIFRLANQVTGSTYENGIAKVTAPWGEEAGRTIPEISSVCRFVIFGRSVFRKGEQNTYESFGYFADSTALSMFTWPLVQGDSQTALTQPNSIVLDENLAKKYFDGQDPIGQPITIDGEEYQVTGVMEEVPENSHFRPRYLVSLSTYSHPDMNDWSRWNQFYTYVQLRENAAPGTVETKLQVMLERNLDAERAAATHPFLQPLASIHLHSKLHREIGTNSDITYVYLFSIIALFILVIACFNFINLATARAVHRAKEVVMRKVTGATRGSLIRQYLGESYLVVSLSVLLALLLATTFLPFLNTFLGSELTLDLAHNGLLTGALITLTLLVGLLSGAYPAFVLSGFRPGKILKGSVSLGGGSGLLRKGLVVAQFAIAVFLIIGALVISSQLAYIKNKNLGFNKEQVVVIDFRDEESVRKAATIKSELLSLPGVQTVSVAANRPGGSDYGVPYEAVGLPEDQQPAMRCLVVDPDFLDTYQMELAAGRNFRVDMATDSAAYLINETAARQLGWEDPVGQQLAMPAVGREAGPIIGVVKDFHFRSLQEPIAPLYFFMEPSWCYELSLRLEANYIEKTLAEIEQKWAVFEPGQPFTYRFFDESFDSLHEAESRTATIIKWFTVIAIFITGLGLFGLSTYTAERRTREIGIRKVLGASVVSLVGMLSRDFLRLVIIGFILAIPLAWIVTRQWLSNYAYHIDVSWRYFVLAGIIAVLIAFLTVSYQSLRAALVNPVESLKNE
ncbi:ABC transporter permease [Flavilitoribacter nigricans]|nr:ABC transporter permease [Flavilitoribacter nigricans]